MPRLRVSTAAFVEISVAEEAPPMLPVRLDRVTLPVAVVLIVFVADPVMFPEPVLKLTDFSTLPLANPRIPLRAMPLALPWSRFMLRLVTIVSTLKLYAVPPLL